MIACLLLLLQVGGCTPPPTPDPLAKCLRTLQASPKAKRIPSDTWASHATGLTLDSRVLAQPDAQPEFTLPIWDYVAVMVDDERVADGQKMLLEHRATVDSIARKTRSLTRIDDTPLIAAPLSASTTAGLFTPTGAESPAFLVFSNFDALYRYNAAESYTLAIAQLADRIAGMASQVAAWPTDDLGLSRAERRELQRLLALRGHPVGAPTGYLATATREAIKLEQQRLGRPVTGRPGQVILRTLRSEAKRGTGAHVTVVELQY